jgi:hypothetical protein
MSVCGRQQATVAWATSETAAPGDEGSTSPRRPRLRHSALGYRTPEEFEQLSPNGECGTQPAEQKEEWCLMPPTRASLGALEAPECSVPGAMPRTPLA